ncbi:MAG: GYD domain-containing protein [Candidatus Dormibacteria bacterium]
MPKYLFEFSYSTDGVKGLLEEGGTSRRDATARLAESLGGEVEAYYFAFGGRDGFLIADVPDNAAAAGASLIASASGAVSVTTTVLLSPEEIDAAARMHGDYRPPGS